MTKAWDKCCKGFIEDCGLSIFRLRQKDSALRYNARHILNVPNGSFPKHFLHLTSWDMKFPPFLPCKWPTLFPVLLLLYIRSNVIFVSYKKNKISNVFYLVLKCIFKYIFQMKLTMFRFKRITS